MSGHIIAIVAGSELPREAGGKAIGLQRIAEAGYRIPSAWVVLPEATGSEIETLAGELERREARWFAVRSSAPDEDDSRSSFAGIHETRLGVTPDDLREAVAAVAASTLSDRAYAYRRELGLLPPRGECAVVVQEMVAAECAGIAFGLGEDNDHVVIEAVEGIGDVAVEGRVKPEVRYLRCEGSRWRAGRSSPRTQSVATRVTGDGISRQELETPRHDTVLGEHRAVEIAACVAGLQERSGRRLDVEWAVASGAVWLLQARPQTRTLEPELPAGHHWTRVNARDVLPDLPSAFCRAGCSIALNAAGHAFAREYGMRLDPSTPLYAHVHGRPVFNELGYLPSDLAGVPRAHVQAELGGIGEPDNSVPVLDLGAVLRRPMLMVRGARIALGAERGANRFIARMRRAGERLEARYRSASTDRDFQEILTGEIDGLWTEWARQSMFVAVAVSAAQYPLHWLLRKHPAPRPLVASLLADGGGTVSTRQLEDLLDLAEGMRGRPEVEAFVSTVTSGHRSLDHWMENLPPDLGRKVEDWLDRYGHRGPYESDLSRPRYMDDLTLLARALFPLVTAERFVAGEERAAGRKREADRAWKEIKERCGRLGVLRARGTVRKLKRLTALRERLRSEVVTVVVWLRRAGLELGRRFAEQGRLQRVDEIWHLSVEEIRRAVKQPAFDLRVAVARELARRAAWSRIEVPNRFRTEDIPAMAVGGLKAAPDSTSLQGNGISPGVVEGEVRVLLSPTDDAKFSTGAILVAPATDPAWTPLFARATGIIVEMGGVLSHAGIVAREYGIPCVANIDGVTRILRDGDAVRIDGSQGTVTVTSR